MSMNSITIHSFQTTKVQLTENSRAASNTGGSIMKRHVNKWHENQKRSGLSMYAI
jgi:hypothetical protein